MDARPLVELVRDPPGEWPCAHRREEERLTEPFALGLGGLLVREYQVRTERMRWVDGLVLHADSSGRPFPTGVLCGKCLGPARQAALNAAVRGARATLVQTKRATLGTVLLGQTLFGALALELAPWAPTSLDAVALCTGREPELERLLLALAGCERLRVEVGSLGPNGRFRPGVEQRRKPSRQIRADRALLEQSAAALGLRERRNPVTLESGEEAEAVFATPDGFVCLHAVPRPMSLAAAGLVLFFGEVLAARNPAVQVRSLGVTTKPDSAVTRLLRRYPRCDALRPNAVPW